jgi:hypothetical protein
MCSCGGVATTLPDGVYYILTDAHEIVFRGICNQCGEGVRVTKPIVDLIMHCPMDDKKAN